MFQRIVDQYTGCCAVIVGVGGIGRAIAQMLADHTAVIVAGDRDQRLLDALQESIDPKKLKTKRIDVGDPASVSEFFQFIQSEAGPPKYLFYTAGILNLEPLSETTSEHWSKAVEVNLNGAFYCVQAAAALMKPQGTGSILILGSIAGTRARSGSRVNPVYNTTKAGISAFVNSAAMQFRPQGVRINCISPGPTSTAMMELQPKQVHEAIGQITLDRRQNSPAEVAELAVFVAGHGRFTGEDLGMGGGAGLGG